MMIIGHQSRSLLLFFSVIINVQAFFRANFIFPFLTRNLHPNTEKNVFIYIEVYRIIIYFSTRLFSASVECPLTSYQTTDTVVCDFSLTNNGDRAYSVLKWNTPLNDLAVNGLTVSHDGTELSPEGIMMKREDPGAGAFLTIAAGETVSSKFDLFSEYDTTKAGTYTVAVDLYLEYVERSAGSLQETRLFYLSSPAVSFQVVQSNQPKRK